VTGGTRPGSPFTVDPTLAERRGGLVQRSGETFGAALAEAMAGPERDPRHPTAVIPRVVVTRLVEAFGLRDADEAMLLALETARAIARPPISGYRVGAVGLAAESGDLVLGGNLELVGASIAHTVHAEGFVTLLARARGERLAALALTQARPCAHCRQVLTEMEGAAGLRVIDPGGHVLAVADLYPWPFGPGDLDESGAVPSTVAFPYLGLDGSTVPGPVADLLLETGRTAHAPYSGVPAAVVLRLSNGTLVAGSVLESVAFNPTIGPVQDALVRLVAMGAGPVDIEGAWLAVPRGASVNHEASSRDALAALAPGVALQTGYWT